MRIDYIECFRVLAETLNYTNAANRLYMTQSSLTRTIQLMEEELGFQLFDRTRRSVTLTPAGHNLYNNSDELLKKYYSIIERARNVSDGYSGIIHFATHAFSVNAIVLDIIHNFQKKYPEIYLEIKASNSERMISSINEKFVDCAIGTTKSLNKDIKRIPLKYFRNCVVLSPDHLLSNKKEISFEELRNERFAVISRKFAGLGYESIKSKARRVGFDPFIEEAAESVQHLLSIIATGRAITILSDNYKDIAMERLKFIPLIDESIVELAFMWDQNSKNPCVNIFAEFIRENYGSSVL